MRLPKSRILYSSSVAATRRLADDFIKKITTSTIFSLAGPIGSGKTAFVQGLGVSLGIRQRITSPTFTLLHEYPMKKKWRGWTFYHFDLYRMKSVEDFFREGFEEIFQRPRSIIAIEWPNRVLRFLPPRRTLFFSFSTVKKKLPGQARSKTSSTVKKIVITKKL